MFVTYPKLGTSPDDGQILDEIDEIAIARFMAAYTEYVKALGTNTIEAMAISHPVGDNGDFDLTTLHIRLAGIGQTLMAVPMINEESVERIREWLAEEFDEPLFEEGEYALCELEIHQRRLTIEETIPVFEDIDLKTPMPASVTINVIGAPVLATAFYAFAFLDADLADEETGEMLRPRLTTFAMATDEPCPDCDEPMVILRGVYEKLDKNGGRHGHRAFSQRLHKDEYHTFSLLLNDLCQQVGEDGFRSLSHEGLSEADFMAAVGELHKEEIEGFASLMEGLAGVLMDAANPSCEEGEGKPTLH